jgi:hypothetical protein
MKENKLMKQIKISLTYSYMWEVLLFMEGEFKEGAELTESSMLSEAAHTNLSAIEELNVIK